MSKKRLELTWFNKDKALISMEKGKYGYAWVSPDDPRYCESHFLIQEEYVQGKQTPRSNEYEYSELSDLVPQSDNLMVLGESGHVLKSLIEVPELAEKYVGQVKLIYIDPPFNTSKTFESYEDNLEHSIWLSMMRDRLLLLKKLLSEDGSIWVHLDDVEVHRMRVLMDEVFRAENYIAEMHWQKSYSPKNDSDGIPMVTDTILVYKKGTGFLPNSLPRTEEMNSRYSNPDNDINGVWKSGDTTAPGNKSGKKQHPSTYGIQHPITGQISYPALGRHWNYGPVRMLDYLSEYAEFSFSNPDMYLRKNKTGLTDEYLRNDVFDLLLVDPNKSRISALERIKKGNWPLFHVSERGFGRKVPLKNASGRIPVNLLLWQEVDHSDIAIKEIKALFPNKESFSTPKPERLLERIINIGSNPGELVLDCFAGSGTTAAVAQKMGRRWVTCELLESNFNTYTRPRLEMVVKNQDPGGITFTKKRILKDGAFLPDGYDADKLFQTTQLLNKVDNEESLSQAQKEAIREVKKLIATRPSKTLNWHGGGGFQVAKLSPPCFDYDRELNRVVLTSEATGETLIRSVAANLGFKLLSDSDNLFDGERGKSKLKVIEGAIGKEMIDYLLSHLKEDETLTIAANSVPDGMREYLRKSQKGSQIVALPDDVFRFTREERKL